MKVEVGFHVVIVSWLLSMLLLVGVSASLTGCGTYTASGATNSNLLTDSDEPESRKRARLRLELAVAYFDKGQTTDALDQIKLSIGADPNLMEAYNLRGLVYMRLNESGLAEDSFRRALTFSPKSASVQHNFGWMLCQQGRLTEALEQFSGVLNNPTHADKSKTWMTQGLCQQKHGNGADAELSFQRSYELDVGNPIAAYNLALLLFQRGENAMAQFYVRRLNNSDLANAESLWLGIKVEQRLNNRDALAQLGVQLKKRFPQSRESALFDKGAFNE